MRAQVATILLASTLACHGRVQAPPEAPVFPMAIAWSVRLTARPAGPLATDGTRVFAALHGGAVTAYDLATGAQVWQVDGRGGDLAVARETLVSRAQDGTVWGIELASGSARWKAATPATGAGAIATSERRVLVVGAGGAAALNARGGEPLWTAEGRKASAAAFSGDLALLVDHTSLQARRFQTGDVAWTTTMPLRAAPLDDGEGRILVPTTGGRLFAVRAKDGSVRWRWPIGADALHPPAVAGPLALFPTLEAVLYALGRGNGHLRWRAALTSRPLGAPLVVGSVVLVACAESDITGYALRDGKKVGSFRLPGEIQTPPLLVAGQVVVGLRDGTLVALRMGVPPEPHDPDASPAPPEHGTQAGPRPAAPAQPPSPPPSPTSPPAPSPTSAPAPPAPRT